MGLLITSHSESYGMIHFGKNIIHFLKSDTLEFSCKFIKSNQVELVGEGVLHYDT